MYRSLRIAGLALVIGIAGSALLRGVQAQENDPNTECLSNAKQLGLAVLMYTQDYDEKLPPMKQQATFQKVTMPYIKNASVYKCPVTQQPYALNTALSGKLIAKIAKPDTIPVFWDAKAHPDGKFTVCYLNGHVKRENKKPVITPASPSKGSTSKGK